MLGLAVSLIYGTFDKLAILLCCCIRKFVFVSQLGTTKNTYHNFVYLLYIYSK